jgi:hypothetical protein
VSETSPASGCGRAAALQLEPAVVHGLRSSMQSASTWHPVRQTRSLQYVPWGNPCLSGIDAGLVRDVAHQSAATVLVAEHLPVAALARSGQPASLGGGVRPACAAAACTFAGLPPDLASFFSKL